MNKIPKPKTGLASTPHGKAVRIHVLVEQYLKSERFSALSATSKKNYLSALKSIEEMEMPNNRSMLEDYAHKITYQTADYIKRILGYTLKPATVALRFAVLSSVWELAIRNGQLYTNPWDKAKIKLANLRDVTWTRDNVNSVVNEARKEGYDLLALYVLVGYSTAQRPFSDIRELKWDNLRQDGSTYILDFIISKTNTHILLPLDVCTTELLLSLKRVSEYIFVTSKGKRLTPTCISRQFNIVKFTSGVPKELMLRDLRRTAITEMAQSGATVSEITAITGWRGSEKLLSRYAVVKLETAKNALAKRATFNNT